jgi:hypothetical protein
MEMKCAFVPEFLELPSTLRNPRDGGGGCHGNAILSKFEFTSHVLIHQYQAFDWGKNGIQKKEPRVGGRCTIIAKVKIPGWGKALASELVVYSAHLEVFSGILGRVAQVSEILKYATELKSSFPCQFIG